MRKQNLIDVMYWVISALSCSMVFYSLRIMSSVNTERFVKIILN